MENKTNFGTSNTEMMTISRAEYDADKAYITELEQQNRWLMEQMKLLKRKQFGSSSEKASDEVMEQLNLLFDEAEAYNINHRSEFLSQYPMNRLTDMITNFGAVVVGCIVLRVWGFRKPAGIAIMLFSAAEVVMHIGIGIQDRNVL